MLQKEDGSRIQLQTALNGGEKQVGRFKVDGYAKINDKDHFWEFNGCIYHDCICLGLAEECDEEKVSYLDSVGTLHKIRECEWNKLRKNKLKSFKPQNLCLKSSVTESDIFAAVSNGTFFGFINVSLEVPETIASKFDWLNISYLFTRKMGTGDRERLMFAEKVSNTLIFRYNKSRQITSFK